MESNIAAQALENERICTRLIGIINDMPQGPTGKTLFLPSSLYRLAKEREYITTIDGVDWGNGFPIPSNVQVQEALYAEEV